MCPAAAGGGATGKVSGQYPRSNRAFCRGRLARGTLGRALDARIQRFKLDEVHHAFGGLQVIHQGYDLIAAFRHDGVGNR